MTGTHRQMQGRHMSHGEFDSSANSKWSNISNWPFMAKFMVPAGVSVALIAGVGVGAKLILDKQSETIDQLNTKSLPEAIRFGAFKADVRQVNGTLFRTLTGKAVDPSMDASAPLAELKATVTSLYEQLKASEADVTDEQQLEMIKQLEAELTTYADGLDFLGGVVESDFASVVGFVEQFDTNYAKMAELSDKIIEAQVAAADENAKAAGETLQWGLMVLMGLAAVSVLVTSGAALISAKLTVNGIQRIARTTRDLAQGDLNVDIRSLARRDELGAVVESLEVFKDNAAERQRLAAAEAEQVATRERRAQQVSQLAARFQAETHEMLTALSSAAEELTVTGKGLLAQAEGNGRSSAFAVETIRASSSNVQNVASAAIELGASIEEIGNQASQSARISQTAVAEVDRTNDAMSELSNAAEQIGMVVDLINAIANQTNLLALNATIEAARAGDAGRGFAVVASEVKSLASQTAKATDEIRQRIEQIQKAAELGLGAIGGIGDTTRKISEIASSIALSVSQQSQATNEIARNVNEASDGTNEAAESVVKLSEAARENASASQNMLQAAQDLSERSTVMSRSVQRFLADLAAA